MPEKKTIKVAAAIIIDDGNVFATQRGYGEFKDGWEFPGGKVEAGEIPEKALKREIKEELDTDIEVVEFLDTVEYDYPGFHLSMDCFICRIITGDLVLREHEAAKWLDKETLGSVDWLPADLVLIDEIRKYLSTGFTFRNIRQDEADQAVRIEHICFPPHEACSEKMMWERINTAPELFLVAVDKETGKIAGFLNGLATNETEFRDEFFKDVGMHNPAGENIMLLGLDVLPGYRGKGLAREIMSQYCVREQKKGRKRLVLTCLKEKVEMYEKMGYRNNGIANSSWGDEQWYEMDYVIDLEKHKNKTIKPV